MENIEKIYLFQNWNIGVYTMEEFKDWDKKGEILEKLKKEDVYTHTDSQWGFLLISLDKAKLLEVAETRRQLRVQELQSELDFLNVDYKKLLTKRLLHKAYSICDKENRSTEYTLQFMRNYTGASSDDVTKFLEELVKKQKEETGKKAKRGKLK
jgi:hypothetical protein